MDLIPLVNKVFPLVSQERQGSVNTIARTFDPIAFYVINDAKRPIAGQS